MYLFWDFYIFPFFFFFLSVNPMAYPGNLNSSWGPLDSWITCSHKGTVVHLGRGNYVRVQQGKVEPSSPPSHCSSFWCCLGNSSNSSSSNNKNNKRAATKARESDSMHTGKRGWGSCSPSQVLPCQVFTALSLSLDELGPWSSSGFFCETAISRKAILTHWIKMEIRPQTSTFICKTVKKWKLSTPETESPSGPLKELNFPFADLGQVYKCGRQNSSRGAWAHFCLHPSTRDFFFKDLLGSWIVILS